jgi:hypothetical protein
MTHADVDPLESLIPPVTWESAPPAPSDSLSTVAMERDSDLDLTDQLRATPVPEPVSADIPPTNGNKRASKGKVAKDKEAETTRKTRSGATRRAK